MRRLSIVLTFISTDITTQKVFTTIYELVQVAAGAIRGGAKDAKLIAILKSTSVHLNPLTFA